MTIGIRHDVESRWCCSLRMGRVTAVLRILGVSGLGGASSRMRRTLPPSPRTAATATSGSALRLAPVSITLIDRRSRGSLGALKNTPAMASKSSRGSTRRRISACSYHRSSSGSRATTSGASTSTSSSGLSSSLSRPIST